MEVIFGNKGNVLDAKLRARHDNSVIYSISTEHTLWRGRLVTYLRDRNPVVGGKSVVVGGINWKKKIFDLMGVRKALNDVRRKTGGFGKRWAFEQPNRAADSCLRI